MAQLSQYKINRYRHSLMGFMGYVAEGHWASLFDEPAYQVLSRLLSDEELMSDFLTRYPIHQRDRRRQEVRYVVAHWLADFAV